MTKTTPDLYSSYFSFLFIFYFKENIIFFSSSSPRVPELENKSIELSSDPKQNQEQDPFFTKFSTILWTNDRVKKLEKKNQKHYSQPPRTKI